MRLVSIRQYGHSYRMHPFRWLLSVRSLNDETERATSVASEWLTSKYWFFLGYRPFISTTASCYPQNFHSIPWNEWSPSARCTSDWGCRATEISGQRMPTGSEIRDFNQYRVERLGRDFAAETETAHVSVVTKESRAKVMSNYASGSSLPYVRTVAKQ